jgi:hypothetical protein
MKKAIQLFCLCQYHNLKSLGKLAHNVLAVWKPLRGIKGFGGPDKGFAAAYMPTSLP